MSLNFFKKAIVENDIPLMVRLIGMDKKDYNDWKKVEKKAIKELKNIKTSTKKHVKLVVFLIRSNVFRTKRNW